MLIAGLSWWARHRKRCWWIRRRLADKPSRDRENSWYDSLSSDGRSWRAFHPGHHRGIHHRGIAVVATVTFLVTWHGAATRRLDLARAVTLRLAIGTDTVGAGGCSPRRHAPHSTGERLELKALFLPTTAGLARTVKGAQAGIDGACVGLGTEFVSRNIANGFDGYAAFG